MMGLKTAFDLLEASMSDLVSIKKPRIHTDVEKHAPRATTEVGSRSEIFRRDLAAYSDRRQNLHKIWPSLISRKTATAKPLAGNEEASGGFEVTERLLVHLAMEHLQNEVLEAVHNLLVFAEMKVSNGSMKRNRIVFLTHQIFSLEHNSPQRPQTCRYSPRVLH